MGLKLIQFRLDSGDPVDACVLQALEQCHGSEHKVAKRLVQVYALAGIQNPAVNLAAAQQQAAAEQLPVETCFVAQAVNQVPQLSEDLNAIEVNYGEL